MSSGMMIAVPTLEKRRPHIDWCFSFKNLTPPINFNVVYACVKNKPVDEARNEIVAEAIKQNMKYILFVGDDTIMPAHALRMFLFRMANTPNCAAVGGVYFSKSMPPAPLIFRGNGSGSYWDWKVGEYFEVTGMGLDCILLDVDWLRKVPAPWFKTRDEDQFINGRNSAEMWTEDLFFFNKLKEQCPDAKIMCDSGVIAEHIDEHGNRYTLPPNSLPMRRLAFGLDAKNTHRIVDLGCGPVHQQFPEGVPVRVDLDERWNPDMRADVRHLPMDDAQFDIVFSSHCLEHFSRADQHVCMAEWKRIMVPGGELRLVLPNLEWAADKLLKFEELSEKERRDAWNVLYGAQSSPYDFHMNGFTPSSLREFVAGFGFRPMTCRIEGYNIIANFRDTRPPEKMSTMGVATNQCSRDKTDVEVMREQLDAVQDDIHSLRSEVAEELEARDEVPTKKFVRGIHQSKVVKVKVFKKKKK